MTAKEARKQKGITLAELSKDTGLSISLLSKIENGKTTMTEQSKQILDGYFKNDITTTSYTMRLQEENKQLKAEVEAYKKEMDLLNTKLLYLKGRIAAFKKAIGDFKDWLDNDK